MKIIRPIHILLKVYFTRIFTERKQNSPYLYNNKQNNFYKTAYFDFSYNNFPNMDDNFVTCY